MVKCNICELTCDISLERAGHCGMYKVVEGRIVPRYENQISAFSIGYIEDVPIFHFHPGSLTLTLGTAGCNFDCSYCMNSFVISGSLGRVFRHRLTPSELIEKARQERCRNIAFTLNEPAVSLPFFLDLARAAQASGMRVGCATNGYFTVEATAELLKHLDFVNISLKSISDDFYQRNCRVPGVEPVLRNIELFFKAGVHVEITTPVSPELKRAEMKQIAEFISKISNDIPWHLFRLLPEYRMAREVPTSVDDMQAIRRDAYSYLNHVYIGNLLGSDWLDTCCPQCGAVLIHRINTGGCGAKLVSYQLDKGSCTQCGAKIAVVGECSLVFDGFQNSCAYRIRGTGEVGEEALGLLDTQGQQKLFDFKSGGSVARRSPLINAVAEIAACHPYPGDSKPESDSWVTELALELLEVYPADLVVLDYAQAFFCAVNQPEDPLPAFEKLFATVDKFLSITGYEPLIWGCGDMEEVRQIVDLEGLLGSNEVFSLSSGKYAQLRADVGECACSAGLQELRRFSKVLTREEFLNSLVDGYSESYAESVGDYVAIAHPGVLFQGLGSQGRRQYRTTRLNDMVPVYTTLDYPSSIMDVAPAIAKALGTGKKVALIVLEGVGFNNFPYPAQSCLNRSGELSFQTPWEQYLTLSTGIPYNSYQWPLSNRYWLEDYRPYPYSGRFHRLPTDTLGRRVAEHYNLAVGNRSVFTHAAFGADLSMECYCCYMRHYGSMAVFRGHALPTDSCTAS